MACFVECSLNCFCSSSQCAVIQSSRVRQFYGTVYFGRCVLNLCPGIVAAKEFEVICGLYFRNMIAMIGRCFSTKHVYQGSTIILEDVRHFCNRIERGNRFTLFLLHIEVQSSFKCWHNIQLLFIVILQDTQGRCK